MPLEIICERYTVNPSDYMPIHVMALHALGGEKRIGKAIVCTFSQLFTYTQQEIYDVLDQTELLCDWIAPCQNWAYEWEGGKSGFAYLESIQIAEPYQRKGYGTELLKKMETRLMKTTRYIGLHIDPMAAAPFYEKCGYAIAYPEIGVPMGYKRLGKGTAPTLNFDFDPKYMYGTP